MEALRQALGELYAEFGHTPVTVRLSEILDRYVVIEQREELNKCKSIKK